MGSFDFLQFLSHRSFKKYLSSFKLVAEGSSRRVVLVNAQFVIKVATSRGSGIAQNRVEATVSADPLSKNLVATVYAADPKFRWLLVEYCPEAKRGKKPKPKDGNKRWRILEHKYELIDDVTEWGVNRRGYLVQLDYGLNRQIAHKYYSDDASIKVHYVE